MLNKGSNRPFGGKAGSAYRPLLIGHKHTAASRTVLKFLKEGPGYGLVQPVTHLDNRIKFSTMFPEIHC